ncbi:MAG: YopT-type cysteine protease domain-containing protein [Hyphomicrobiaceae bacterium]
MPRTGNWKTWKVVSINHGQYRSSSRFLQRSLVKRLPLLKDVGWCFGSAIEWCLAVRRDPSGTAEQRIERVEARLEGVVSREFLHAETIDYVPECNGRDFAGYLDNMCRVSRLKFVFKHGTEVPDGILGILQLVTQTTGKGLYLLQMSTADDGIEHVAAVSAAGDGTSNFFDENFGEIEIGKFQMARFLTDYYAHYGEEDISFDLVDVYGVHTAPSLPS